MHMVRIRINSIQLAPVVIDNSGNVFFDSFPAFFWDQWLPMQGCQNKMCVQVIEFDLHFQIINKVIRLYYDGSWFSATKVVKPNKVLRYEHYFSANYFLQSLSFLQKYWCSPPAWYQIHSGRENHRALSPFSWHFHANPGYRSYQSFPVTVFAFACE